MPTCTRWIGCCAVAPTMDVARAAAARKRKRRMKKISGWKKM
jgi:hypothetical protein